jgi:hypothetical protein
MSIFQYGTHSKKQFAKTEEKKKEVINTMRKTTRSMRKYNNHTWRREVSLTGIIGTPRKREHDAQEQRQAWG